MTWLNIDTAPFDRDLELAVINFDGAHATAFPCRRIVGGGWMNTITKKIVEIHPTHWRLWEWLDQRD